MYAVGIIVVTHALLESPSKRVALYDDQVGNEIWLYLMILIVLLAVRIPVIRSTLANLRHKPGGWKRIIAWMKNSSRA